MRNRPWRQVLSDPAPRMREGRGGLLGPSTSRRTRWWEMTLSCGHEVQKTVRYVPRTDGRHPSRGGTQHASLDRVAPHPKRVRCESCPLEET